jgi:hypothetical protein
MERFINERLWRWIMNNEPWMMDGEGFRRSVI